MAWTAPRTWTASQALTAAQLNEQIRDNLQACSPGVANNERGYIVSSDANVLAQRIARKHTVLALETTASASYVDLDTLGPTIEVGTGKSALTIWGCQVSNSSSGFSAFSSLGVTGATTIAASTTNAIRHMSNTNLQTQTSQFCYFTELTPGLNTFTMKYAVGGGTGSFSRRRLLVLPF